MSADDDQYIEMTGEILEICRDKFTVLIDDTHNMMVIATCSGKIRISGIKILVGDKVRIKVSSYDPTKGRIVFRMKSEHLK